MTISQNKRIAAHLERGFSITPLAALRSYGCMRLASRIGELRKGGMVIEREMVKDAVTGARYARYWMAKADA